MKNVIRTLAIAAFMATVCPSNANAGMLDNFAWLFSPRFPSSTMDSDGLLPRVTGASFSGSGFDSGMFVTMEKYAMRGRTLTYASIFPDSGAGDFARAGLSFHMNGNMNHVYTEQNPKEAIRFSGIYFGPGVSFSPTHSLLIRMYAGSEIHHKFEPYRSDMMVDSLSRGGGWFSAVSLRFKF